MSPHLSAGIAHPPFGARLVRLAVAALASGSLLAAAQAETRGDGYPQVMGMNIGAKNYHEPAYIQELARADFVILGFFPGWRGDRNGEKIGAVVRQIKARNPSIIVGQYTILNESSDDPVKAAPSRDRIEKLDAEDWWLRTSAGAKTSWTQRYGAFDINFTEWAKPDNRGERYPEWLARRDYEKLFKNVPEFGAWYFDNVMIRSRVGTANWRRDGRDVSSKEGDVESAFRRGMAAHWAAARKLRPDAIFIGNVDNDLSSPEYRGKLNGAFLEGLMGKSWSLERTVGWTGMMKRYLDVKANLLPPAIVGFNVAGDPSDHQFFRYAFCSSLMGDGYFSFTDAAKGYSSVPWFDEYDVKLGKAVDPPQRAAWSEGVYRRRFENAVVLVNPEGSPRRVTIEPGWRRFKGAQAPAVNNGEPANSVVVPARDGLVLVKG